MDENDKIVEEAEAAASSAGDSKALYEAKMQFLGRQGKLAVIMKRMKEIVPEF